MSLDRRAFLLRAAATLGAGAGLDGRRHVPGLARDPRVHVDYVTPVGGGYFFAPPGARGAADWVGSGLLA